MSCWKIGILEPHEFSEHAMGILGGIGHVETFNDNDDVESFIRDKEILFIRLKYFFDANLLARAPRLRYLCTPTTGLNHIDVQYSYAHQIKIVSLKGYPAFLAQIHATSEHIVGMTLTLLRNYVKLQNRNLLNPKNRQYFKGHELSCNTVGLIGLGRIGKQLASIFNGFGACVLGYDINANQPSVTGVAVQKSMEELIMRSNIIILCADYREENYKMIGKEELLLMHGKYFVNASRGELVDERALLEGIKSGVFAGVSIDVIANEAGKKNRLSQFVELVSAENNFFYTPHIGGATYESMEKTEDFITDILLNQLRL